MSHVRFSHLAVLLAFSMMTSARADFIVTDASSYTTTGIGDYAAVGGSAGISSAFGQIEELVEWPSSDTSVAGDPQGLLGTAPTTISGLLALLPAGFGSNTSFVFSIGINETGPVGTNSVDLTALTMTFGNVAPFTLGTDKITIVNFVQGQSTSEAFIQVDLPDTIDNILAANDSYNITGTITNRTDGAEVLFLTSATTVVPEPSAFLYGGAVAAIAGLGYRRRQKSVA